MTRDAYESQGLGISLASWEPRRRDRSKGPLCFEFTNQLFRKIMWDAADKEGGWQYGLANVQACGNGLQVAEQGPRSPKSVYRFVFDVSGAKLARTPRTS